MALAMRDTLVGDVLMTARAAELSPKYALIATDPRRTISDRQEAASCAEALSVALDQPHQRGRAGKRPEDALTIFCRRQRLRRECQQAGQTYDEEIRAEKSAQGFYVVGHVPGAGDDLDEAQREADNELAIADLKASKAVLKGVDKDCPARMETLCYDGLWPLGDVKILRDGLLALALHYGLLDCGINRDKPI